MAPTIVSATVMRELHRIHRQLSDLNDRLVRGPKQIQAHQVNVARAEQELLQAKDEAKQARIASDQKQLQLKVHENKLSDLRSKLQACGSNREYQALLEQIAADEMAKSVLEDEILDGMGRVDDLLAGIGQCEEKLGKAKEELGRVEIQVRERSEVIQGDVTRLQEELVKLERDLPAEFREIYDRTVRSKGSDALASVEGEFCTGCYQQVQANRISQLRMSQVVQCSSCGRLIYLPEEPQRPTRG